MAEVSFDLHSENYMILLLDGRVSGCEIPFFISAIGFFRFFLNGSNMSYLVQSALKLCTNNRYEHWNMHGQHLAIDYGKRKYIWINNKKQQLNYKCGTHCR